MSDKFRSNLLAVVRALISFGLAALLLRVVLNSGNVKLTEEWAACNHELIGVAAILFGAGIVLSSWRMAQLLRVQGIDLKNWDALRLTMIGVFFNLAIPGGVGGDLIKMAYLSKIAGEERTPAAIMTTLFDRILGLLGLFLVALAAMAYRWDFLKGAPAKLQMTVFSVCTVAILGGLSVLAALFSDQFLKIPMLGPTIQKLSQQRPKRLWFLIRKVVKSISLFRHHLGGLLVALACSVMIHVLTALSVVCVGQSVGATHLHLSDYFLAVQVANTVAAVPLFPGGIGGRDFVLLQFFTAAGETTKGAVIGPFLSLLVVVWGLIGGLFFIFSKQEGGNPTPSEP